MFTSARTQLVVRLEDSISEPLGYVQWANIEINACKTFWQITFGRLRPTLDKDIPPVQCVVDKDGSMLAIEDVYQANVVELRRSTSYDQLVLIDLILVGTQHFPLKNMPEESKDAA